MRAEQNEKLFERSEFLSFPLACARRGKPKAAIRQDVLSWGYPFFGQAKKGYKKSFRFKSFKRSERKTFFNVHFFAHSKETNQRKGAPAFRVPTYSRDSLAGHILKGSL